MWNRGYNPNHSILTGVPQATLQTWLTAAQQAYNDLTIGGKVEVASYAQGDGSKAVTYTRANLGQLVQYIQQLQAQLGLRHVGRRPIRMIIR